MKAVAPPQTGPGPGGMQSAQPGAPGSQSLTRRYAGNQPPQQQGPVPSGGQMQPGEQIVRTSTPPPPRTLLGGGGQLARGPQGPVPGGPQGGPMPYGPQGMNQPAPPVYPPAAPPVSLSVESLAATSQAAEHWRNSWRDRQRAEAGPAVGISRGQAVVPEPLMVMQQSLARMRSIIMPVTQEKEATPAQKQLYRISNILLFCLILGLGGYLISSFIPRTLAGAYPSGSVHGEYPTISIPVTAKNTSPAVKPGQSLTISGDSFKPDSTVTFKLDTTVLNATAQTDAIGQFGGKDKKKPAVSVTIPPNQLPGSYLLIAQDKATGQQATMRVHVLPSGAANNTALQLSNDQGTTVKSLSFNTANGADPKPQVLTITNTGAAKVTWSASIVTQNAQNWITLNANNTTNAQYGKVGGEINPDGTDTIAVGVSSAGLASLVKAYQGYVIFTVDHNQLIMPVSFAVQNKSLDVVVTPNPLTVISNGDGTCKPTTLAIINNSDVTITWSVSATKNPAGIQLSQKSSQLTPAGGGADAVTIDIHCGGIQQPTDGFGTIGVFFNNHEIDVPVNVRAN